MKSTYYIEITSHDSFGRFAIYKDSSVADMAQPQRKMGKWIYGNDFHWYTASCNKCGYTRKTDIKATRWNEWKFCPSCGADMRGDHHS